MKRECPRCFVGLTQETIKKGIWKVEVDICQSCGGLYLDKGELMTLTNNRPLHHLTTKNLGIDSDSELLCPSCGSLMDIESAEGTNIDVCLNCNGVWLDKNELVSLRAADPSKMKELSPEKLAELYDAEQAVPSKGILSWLFRR